MPYKKVYGIDDLGNKVPVATYFVPPNPIQLDHFPYNIQVHYDSSSDSYIVDSCTAKLYYDDGTDEILNVRLVKSGEYGDFYDFENYLSEYDGDPLQNIEQARQYILAYNGITTSLENGSHYFLLVFPTYGEYSFIPDYDAFFIFNSDYTYINGIPYYIDEEEGPVQVNYPLQMKVWNYTPKASVLADPATTCATCSSLEDIYDVLTLNVEWSVSGWQITTWAGLSDTLEYTSEWDVYNPDGDGFDPETGEYHNADNWQAWCGFHNYYTLGDESPIPFLFDVNADWDPLSTYVNGVKQVNN